MSLINEALRRARHEAERRDAVRRGLTPPAGPPDGPPDRPVGSIALLAVLGLAIGVGVVGGAALFLRGGDGGPRAGASDRRGGQEARVTGSGAGPAGITGIEAGDSARGVSQGAGAASDPTGASAGSSDERSAAGSSLAGSPSGPGVAEDRDSRMGPAGLLGPTAAGAGSRRPADETSGLASGAAGVLSPERGTAPATAGDSPTRRAGPAPEGAGARVADPGQTSGLAGRDPRAGDRTPAGGSARPEHRPPADAPRVSEDESGVLVVLADESAGTATPPGPGADGQPRSYLRRLELPDGVTVELGGIAWSETGPFALINGRVVGPGEKVSGLRVVGIEPKQVELRSDAGETIYLLLK